jgi:hypothetical protein
MQGNATQLRHLQSLLILFNDFSLIFLYYCKSRNGREDCLIQHGSRLIEFLPRVFQQEENKRQEKELTKRTTVIC